MATKYLRGYGINVRLKGDDSFSRYTTKQSLEVASQIFESLGSDNELKLWDKVEVEKIFETPEGDFEYETIMETEVK